jgi:hypothetical protein
MEFLEIIKNRYSVRAFKPDPVDEGVLQKVLEAARWAPTANNRQPLQLIVIHTEGREAELRRICDRPWFVQAPHIVCACGIPAQSWTRMDGKPYTDVDAAIVMDHLMDRGLRSGGSPRGPGPAHRCGPDPLRTAGPCRGRTRAQGAQVTLGPGEVRALVRYA